MSRQSNGHAPVGDRPEPRDDATGKAERRRLDVDAARRVARPKTGSGGFAAGAILLRRQSLTGASLPGVERGRALRAW
jgi:hypothetical protein